MKIKQLPKKGLSAINEIKNKNPVKVSLEDTSFDLEEDEERVFLSFIDGQDTETKEVRREADDLTLEFEGKECVIASKPLNIKGHKVYFTKHGLQTTIPLNKATMIGGDVYVPSKSTIEFRLPEEKSLKDLDVDEDKFKQKENNIYEVELESEESGETVSIKGSKETLQEQNKAKRSRQLLKKSGLDKQTLLLTLGSGAMIGFILKSYMGQ